MEPAVLSINLPDGTAPGFIVHGGGTDEIRSLYQEIVQAQSPYTDPLLAVHTMLWMREVIGAKGYTCGIVEIGNKQYWLNKIYNLPDDIH